MPTDRFSGLILGTNLTGTDNADGSITIDASGGGGGGGLLAVAKHTAGGSAATTSSTQADVDATNAAITFTAPASGNVLVTVNVVVSISPGVENAFLGIREGTTNVVNKIFVIQGNASFAFVVGLTWQAYITGIAAGSHTYKLAFAVNGGLTFTIFKDTPNPILMSVQEAP